MNLLQSFPFLFLLFSVLIKLISSIYTHASFVNDMRRSKENFRTKRSLSVYEPSEEYSLQMNNTASYGLQPCSSMQCKRIAIVGAGVAGLTIAYELSRAGHRVTVYEANNRAGGRLFTYNTGKTIIELGGMRLPLDIHTLTNNYIRKRFSLPIEPFIGYDGNTFVYINGIKYRSNRTNYCPSQYNLSVYEDEQNKSPFDQWNEAIKPLTDLFFTKGWKSIVDQYGSYNVKQYLSEYGFSSSLIDYIGLMFGIETNLFTALTSHFRDVLLINENTKFYHIIGGNRRLIDRLINQSYSIEYSTTVLSIERMNNGKVNIETKNQKNQTKISSFDQVVVATTAPAARLIRYKPVNQQIQQLTRALRQLHYDCASKIVLYFNRSWWHDQQIFGGSTTTDLPLRFLYYDNYNTTVDYQSTNESVLLASYTFAQDATFLSSLTLDQITNEILNNLEEIHSRYDLRKFYRRTIVKHWCDDIFAHGAYALFLPYQEDSIKPILMKSIDKQIFFAGEHLSTAHAWVEGSILSALGILMQLQEETFDVVLVGGNLLALQTAMRLNQLTPSWNILLLEQDSSSDNINVIKEILKQNPSMNITIRQNEHFIDYSNNRMITDRGTILVKHRLLFLDEFHSNDYLERYLQPYHISDFHETIIDYLPNSNNQSIVLLGQTDPNRFLDWSKLLTDLTLDIPSSLSTDYSFQKNVFI